MGNTTSNSNSSSPECSTKAKSSHAISGSTNAPDRKDDIEMSSIASVQTTSLDRENLCTSLRERGLCVAESDLGVVLAKHNNLIEALTFVVESGLGRRTVKAKRGPPSDLYNKKRRENSRPPLPAPASTATTAITTTTASSTSLKRARQREPTESSQQSGVRPWNERPLKRTACAPFRSIDEVRPTADTPFTKALDGSGLAEVLASGDAMKLVDGADSTLVCHREEDRTEQMERHALLPMQPGSPPGLRVSQSQATPRKAPERSSSPTSLTEKPAERAFVALPEQLNVGNLDTTLMLGVERWIDQTPEEKENTVRAVKRDLRLPPVGPECQERLSDKLSHAILAALDGIDSVPSLQDGASLIGNMVYETRKIIHNTTVKVSGAYRELYQQPPSGRSNSSSSSSSSSVGSSSASSSSSNDSSSKSKNVRSEAVVEQGALESVSLGSPSRSRQLQVQGSHLTSRSPSQGDRSSKDSRAMPTSGHAFGSSFGATAGTRPGFGISSSGRTSFFSRPKEPQPPAQTPASKALRNGGSGDGTPVLGPTAAARAQISPDDLVFWTANDICKEALRKAAFARKEEEWLENQAKFVRDRVEGAREDSARSLGSEEETVAKLRGEVQIAAEAIEVATRDVIGAHLTPDASTEEALRSLLSAVQQGRNRSAQDKLDARKRAIDVHTAMSVTLQTHNTSLLLHRHGTKINTVLYEELFGDLLEVISSMQRQANERRVSCQTDLKSTANHLLEKVKSVVKFHVARKRTAEDKVDLTFHTIEEERRLFGDGSTTSRVTQAYMNEMKAYAVDSVKKTKEIKRQAHKMCSKIEVELPEEDFLRMTEGAKAFFSAQADLANAEAGGRNPGSFGIASDSGGEELDESDDCRLM